MLQSTFKHFKKVLKVLSSTSTKVLSSTSTKVLDPTLALASLKQKNKGTTVYTNWENGEKITLSTIEKQLILNPCFL